MGFIHHLRRAPRAHPPRRRARGRAAQGTVEFALVSLTFLLLTFGVVDLGRAVVARVMLTNALREAARYGLVGERSAATVPGGTDCNAATYCGRVVAAAQRRAPGLGLTADHFTDAATSPATVRIGCSQWTAAAGAAFWDPAADGSLAACAPPSASNPGGVGITGRLTVCAEYRFGLAAPRLLGLESIRMRECARVALQ